jgi:hypothetical protein
VKTIIGIDNGTATGGLCAISAHDGAIIGYRDMPWKIHKSRKEVDLGAFAKWLFKITDGMECGALLVIEEPNNSRNASTAYSVSSCFHSLRGYFTARNLTFERITPQSWQKKMLGKVPKGETKKYAALAAVGRWPFEEFTKNARCKVLHTGIVDAALIAEYGRLTFTNKPLANPEELG